MMSKLYLFFLIFALIFSGLLNSEKVYAAGAGGIAFHLPIEFRTRNVSVNGGSSTTTQYFNMIPSLGYQYSDTLFLGVNYHYTNETGGTSYKGGVYGPSLGITASNFNLSIAYYVGGSLTETTGGADTVYSSGSGPEFSLGYLFPASGNFAWGPQFIYSDIKYTSTQSGGVTSSSTYEITGIEPYIGLFFNF